MNDSQAGKSTPFELLGGDEQLVVRLVRTFYRRMAEAEPELARTHELAPDGTIAERSQERFTRFLIEWLGGPARYTPTEGHPRLRMRHARVSINTEMSEAWVRCMCFAMDAEGIDGKVRDYLGLRFDEVAKFLRNTPD